MEITVESNIRQVRSWFNAAERKQLPFAIALALTRTAQHVKVEEVTEMKRVFDRPTPYTLNALAVKPATKKDLVADVRFKDFASLPAKRYLNPNVHGGGRSHKRSEKALIAAGHLPGGRYLVAGRTAPKDRYGNIPGGTITRILSQVKAQRDPTQNTSRRGAGSRGYFYLPGRGVYERTGKKTMRPVLVETRSPSYRKRFHFYVLANQVVQKQFDDQFARAFQHAMQTARR